MNIETFEPPRKRSRDQRHTSNTNSGSMIDGNETAINDDTKHDQSCQKLINTLALETSEEAKLNLLSTIRNLITACNQKKESLVADPNFKKILCLLDDNQSSPSVKKQLALLLCSLAKGGEKNITSLSNLNVDFKIIKLILVSQIDDLTEACLRCLRSLMSCPNASRLWLLYDNKINDSVQPNANGTENGPQRMINYAKDSKSFIIQECVADIFAQTCCRSKDQIILYRSGALSCIVQFLESASYRVIVAALNWLKTMCLRNQIVSLEAIKCRCPSGELLLDRLTKMMNKDESYELQFLSSRCFSHIYRAIGPEQMRDDHRIITHVIPTLVRMVHCDKPPQLRAKAAASIAYLIECETRLQSTASICDHSIESLASMLDCEPNGINHSIDWRTTKQIYTNYRCSREREVIWRSNEAGHNHRTTPMVHQVRSTDLHQVHPFGDTNTELNQEMRRSAFLALAALASNLEPIRKKIFNTSSVLQHLVKSLGDADTKTLKAVLTCLLSLSRSVQQLRTSFSENNVYNALKGLFNTSSNEVLVLVLAILCNLSLDFSPQKQQFLDEGTIRTLCSLTKGSDRNLRLHGMWILMNMVYQLKDQNLKFQILRTLGPDHLLSILENENDEELILKTLGFMRNLLSQKSHIDAIMNSHGDQIMHSLIRVLEKPCSARIKEQTLCVLTNIADGIDSKALIMKNRVLLSYLSRTICDEQAGDMRLAAICCITNLAQKEQEGSTERQGEMKKFGIEETLKSLLDTKDPILSDRIRTAYNQFLNDGVDKYDRHWKN